MPANLLPIADALRRQRHALRLSQAAVARRAGVTQAQVSALEKGANARTATTVAVGRALGMELTFVPSALVPAVDLLVAGKDPATTPLYALEEDDEGNGTGEDPGW